MGQERGAVEQWAWLIRFGIVILLLVILAAALGSMSLFQNTRIGAGVTAAKLVQFLGYGAALVMLWLVARKFTIVIMEKGGNLLQLQHLVLPLVTLLVIALAYLVQGIIFKSLLGATFTAIVNWLFILCILLCVAWLIAAIFNHTSQITEALTGRKSRKS